MSVWGTPNEGRDNILLPAVYISSGLDLRLYTNTADSLTRTSVFADLNFPTGSGYATITLDGSWAFSNGVATYDHGTPNNPLWTAGDSWAGGPVVGVAMTDGTYILHHKDLSLGSQTMTVGDIIEVDINTFVG